MRGAGGGVDRLPARTNLEKPLEDLSHEDIMQLTREDCRRYLTEKGSFENLLLSPQIMLDVRK